jgi:membrane protein
MIALVFVAIGMLRTIEGTFNDIWGVSRGRGFIASFVQYWATITIGPVLLIVAFGLTTGPRFLTTAQVLDRAPVMGKVFLWLLPFIVLSLAFSMFYQWMPNTEVKWRAAIAGGIVGGCLFQLNNICSVFYVSQVVTYSKIYGSLGVVPLLLVGLYLSWLILLFGAQVAYAFQNRQAYLQDKQAESVNQRGREFVGLRLMTRLAQAFQSREPPLSIQQLAESLDVPGRLIAQLITAFLHTRLVVEVNGPDAVAYAPGKPLDQITAYDVLMALRMGQGQEVSTRDGPACAGVRSEFERIVAAERTAASPVTLKMLADACS